MLNKKVLEASETYIKNSASLTELIKLINSLDIQGLISSVTDIKSTISSKEKHLVAWAKSTNSLAQIRSEFSVLRKDTSNIKSMMSEIYQAFKGQSNPSTSVLKLTLALTEGPTTVGGRTILKLQCCNQLPLILRGSTDAQEEPTAAIPISSYQPPIPEQSIPEEQPALSSISTKKGKEIVTTPMPEQAKLVPASSIIRQDPDEPVRAPYMINGKLYHLTNDQINAHTEQEDALKKFTEEQKRLALKKPVITEIIQEKAKKLGINPKKITCDNAGVVFKKAQDAEMDALKRQHTKNAKRNG